jgi:hypothetical protein
LNYAILHLLTPSRRARKKSRFLLLPTKPVAGREIEKCLLSEYSKMFYEATDTRCNSRGDDAKKIRKVNDLTQDSCCRAVWQKVNKKITFAMRFVPTDQINFALDRHSGRWVVKSE